MHGNMLEFNSSFFFFFFKEVRVWWCMEMNAKFA